jgi:hypothetical protein
MVSIPSLVLRVLCIIAISAGLICSLNVNQQHTACHLETRSAPQSQRIESVRGVGRFGAAFGGAVLGCLASEGTSAKRAFAVSGSIKSSTLAESKEAVGVVKKCIDSLVDMERAVAAGDYNEMGRLLSGKEFLEFEKAATVLVRSDALNADEKVSLGTIKRYGLVADAIIMLGGLGGELKQGGIQVAGGGNPNAANIEEDEEEDDGSPENRPSVNGPEVRKYLKLSKDALLEIYKVVVPILKRS